MNLIKIIKKFMVLLKKQTNIKYCYTPLDISITIIT